jgi:N-acetyl-anhydromuramyl-L-alanine amidase AmpD
MIELAKRLLMTRDDYRMWQWIVIHHSATRDQKTNDWETIRRWHTGEHPQSNLRWKDIGYHFGVEREDKKIKLRKGRDLRTIGAHAGSGNKMFNQFGLGVCIIGNFDTTKPDDELIDTAAKLCHQLCYMFDIPYNNIIGHREVYKYFQMDQQKTCPGTNFDMARFRKLVALAEL